MDAKGGGDDSTALMFACEKGHVEAARLLLEKGAAVDAQDENGVTPLMTACEEGHVEVARLLLEKGADRTLADKEGRTALDHVDMEEDDEDEGEGEDGSEDGSVVTEETKEQLRALLR